MTAKELYLYALDQAAAVVRRVSSDQFGLPTPDTEWEVRDLLGHMVYELAWTADVVTGKTITEVGDKYDGDLLGDDAHKAWRTYEAQTRQALAHADEAGPAHLSYTTTTVGEYLWEAGNDQLVHAWDLGQAIGLKVVFNEAVAQALYERAQARRDEFSASGLFAPPVEVKASASAQTKLLALLGRSEKWVKA